MVKSSNCCLVQTFSLPNILSSFFWMKFANLVAVSSIQRTQTGGLLSLLSFFPCRGPYISFWSLVSQVFGWPIFTAWFLVGCLPTCSWDLTLCLAATTIFVGILKFIAFCAQIDFFGLRASTLWEPESWYVLYHDGRLQDTFSKNISFDDPQKGGHFSCRKPVSHVGTSTEGAWAELRLLLVHDTTQAGQQEETLLFLRLLSRRAVRKASSRAS